MTDLANWLACRSTVEIWFIPSILVISADLQPPLSNVKSVKKLTRFLEQDKTIRDPNLPNRTQ